MIRYSITFFIFLSAVISFSQTKKILIVSTNRDSVGTNKSGTFLKEIAYPFQHFISQGFDVDIVTPQGGKASLYHWGEMPEALNAIQTNELFKTKTSATLHPTMVNATSYAGIFFPGGHGQYFDVVDDERIAAIAASIYEMGGVVGTAGHGAASLINVRLGDGRYVVDGVSMTCFPHWAELAYMNISNYGKLLAFDMQEVLQRRGAHLRVSSRETRSNPSLNLVADTVNRIVTGAFAQSAQWVAENMVNIIRLPKAKTERENILKAVNKYVVGRNNGDIEMLRSAFHPTASLKGVDEKGELSTISAEAYVNKNKAGRKHDCITTIRLLDHTTNTATVKVTLAYPTYSYHDYLIVMKVGGEWIITEKIYTKTETITAQK